MREDSEDEIDDADFDSDEDELHMECYYCDGDGRDFLSGATCPHCDGCGWI